MVTTIPHGIHPGKRLKRNHLGKNDKKHGRASGIQKSAPTTHRYRTRRNLVGLKIRNVIKSLPPKRELECALWKASVSTGNLKTREEIQKESGPKGVARRNAHTSLDPVPESRSWPCLPKWGGRTVSVRGFQTPWKCLQRRT